MFAIVIFFFIALYLIFSALVVWLAVRWARKHGRSPKRWELGAALAMTSWCSGTTSRGCCFRDIIAQPSLAYGCSNRHSGGAPRI
jgi:hypothetical protein